jgi:hypothetical protein
VNPAGVEDLYRLSPVQASMLFEILASGDRSLYVEQGICTLRGDVIRDVLECALQSAIQRHASLRTSFHWEGLSKPVQVVHRTVEFSLEWLDVRGLDAAAVQDGLRNLLERNRREPFDLTRAPLLRAALLHTAGDRHRFVWCVHHLVHDAWSTAIVLGDLLAAYAAAADGVSRTAPAPAPYRDYVAWWERLGEEEAKAFWCEHLRDCPVDPALPAAFSVPGGEWGHIERTLPAELSARIAACARTLGITLHSLVAGAWAIALAVHGGAQEVVFGSVTSGRPLDLRGVDSMTGVFINTLPVRIDCTGNLAAGAWLTRIHHAQVAARSHEHVPVSTLRRWRGLAPDTALFRSVLVLQNAFNPARLNAGAGSPLRIEDVRSAGRSSVPFTVRVTPGERILLEVLGNFGSAPARALDTIAGALECFAHSPDAQLRDLIGSLQQSGRQRTPAKFSAA